MEELRNKTHLNIFYETFLVVHNNSVLILVLYGKNFGKCKKKNNIKISASRIMVIYLKILVCHEAYQNVLQRLSHINSSGVKNSHDIRKLQSLLVLVWGTDQTNIRTWKYVFQFLMKCSQSQDYYQDSAFPNFRMC